MLLQCPECSAKYNVPDHAVGPEGRKVRCKQCTHEWLALPPAAAVEAGAAPTEKAAPSSPSDAEESKRPPRASSRKAPAKPKKPSFTAAFLKPPSTALVGSLAASAIFAVVCVLFATAPGLFGLKKTSGVTMNGIKLSKQAVDNGVEYAISGELWNETAEIMSPPKIRISLVDKTGSAVQFWEPSLPETMAASEKLPFTFGPLKTKFTRADRLVIELGNPLELALRSKP